MDKTRPLLNCFKWRLPTSTTLSLPTTRPANAVYSSEAVDSSTRSAPPSVSAASSTSFVAGALVTASNALNSTLPAATTSAPSATSTSLGVGSSVSRLYLIAMFTVAGVLAM